MFNFKEVEHQIKVQLLKIPQIEPQSKARAQILQKKLSSQASHSFVKNLYNPIPFESGKQPKLDSITIDLVKYSLPTHQNDFKTKAGSKKAKKNEKNTAKKSKKVESKKSKNTKSKSEKASKQSKKASKEDRKEVKSPKKEDPEDEVDSISQNPIYLQFKYCTR